MPPGAGSNEALEADSNERGRGPVCAQAPPSPRRDLLKPNGNESLTCMLPCAIIESVVNCRARQVRAGSTAACASSDEKEAWHVRTGSLTLTLVLIPSSRASASPLRQPARRDVTCSSTERVAHYPALDGGVVIISLPLSPRRSSGVTKKVERSGTSSANPTRPVTPRRRATGDLPLRPGANNKGAGFLDNRPLWARPGRFLMEGGGGAYAPCPIPDARRLAPVMEQDTIGGKAG